MYGRRSGPLSQSRRLARMTPRGRFRLPSSRAALAGDDEEDPRARPRRLDDHPRQQRMRPVAGIVRGDRRSGRGPSAPTGSSGPIRRRASLRRPPPGSRSRRGAAAAGIGADVADRARRGGDDRGDAPGERTDAGGDARPQRRLVRAEAARRHRGEQPCGGGRRQQQRHAPRRGDPARDRAGGVARPPEQVEAVRSLDRAAGVLRDDGAAERRAGDGRLEPQRRAQRN